MCVGNLLHLSSVHSRLTTLEYDVDIYEYILISVIVHTNCFVQDFLSCVSLARDTRDNSEGGLVEICCKDMLYSSKHRYTERSSSLQLQAVLLIAKLCTAGPSG